MDTWAGRAGGLGAPHVALSRAQSTQLESMLNQQVQDAIRAHASQGNAREELDAPWKSVGSVGHLKTYKQRGTDSCSTEAAWASTVTSSGHANIERQRSSGVWHTWNPRNRRSTRSGRQSRSLRASSRLSRSGRISRSRAMSRGAGNDLAEARGASPRDVSEMPLQSFRTFGRVQGHYRDILDVHHATNSVDFLQQQKLLSPCTVDAVVLRTIRASKDSYLGLKWLAEAPFGGKRDVCYVEMVGYTVNGSGREIGFVAMASVDVPECPEMTKFFRMRMKRTMLVIPTDENPKVTSEIFIMGATDSGEPSMVANAQHRLTMTILNDISLVIDSQNLAKQSLARQHNWVPDQNRPACSICSRKFNFMYRRRHHCRLCGDVICKTCYVLRAVPGAAASDAEVGQMHQQATECSGSGPSSAAAIGQTKFCVRCVMGLRTIDRRLDNFSHMITELLATDVTVGSTSVSLEQDVQPTLKSPPSMLRDSSVTYFKRGSKQKRTLDLGQLYKLPSVQSEAPDAAFTVCDIEASGSTSASHSRSSSRSDVLSTSVTSTIARSDVGRLDSVGAKMPRRSLSIDPAHSSSYTKLQRLSRHSSAAILEDTQYHPIIAQNGQIHLEAVHRTALNV